MALEPFACFMDVENSRSYIDELYSDDAYKCQEAIVCLKNAVIGSNKKKGSVISQGIVPRLIALLRDESKDPALRLDAAIVIGSLAKGTESQVHSLIYYETVQVLLGIVINPGTERRLMETCLGALKTVLQYPFAPIELLHSNIGNLQRLIQLASPDSSIQCQEYVANIFVPLCHSSHQQKNLCQANVIPFLARLMTTQLTILQVPALKCLAAMCFTNKYVSDAVCMTCHEERSILDILTVLLSRTRDVQIQLSASRCLTYLHRSGSLRADDYRIVYKTLPSLARLCSEDFDEETRATAAETLAYLAEIDSELQRLAAISNHLICSLANLIRCPSPLSRQGAFRCFASLAANDEDIRKRIIEMDGLMEEVLNGLKDTCPEVRLSAVRCLHSLSRSVQLLRTTFQDHSVWRPLMDLIGVGEPSLELLTVVTSTICNLLLEFSPAKEPMLESGAVEMLCELTKHQDAALRLNGSWALMNMAFQAEQHVKSKIINTLGTDRIFQLLGDSDERVIMKTLGLLRNLLSNTLHIEIIMSEHSSEVLRAVNLVLDGPHPPEVKEQALIIISNITAGARDKDYVLEDENIIKKIREFLVVSDNKLQMGAVFVVRNLMDKSGRQKMLRESGILENLEQLLHMTPRDSQFYEDIRQEILRFDFSDEH